MIARDLELLGAMRKLNAEMGGIVATLLEQMLDGELPAAKLRELAGIAHDLGNALEQRAEEISPTQERRLVIDGEVAEGDRAHSGSAVLKNRADIGRTP